MSASIPKYGWSRDASDVFPDPRNQNLRPSFSQIIHLIPLALRYALHFLSKLWQGRKPPIDQIRMLTGKAIYGVPCGGIGAGTIGRGFRGEFCRFQLNPGMYSYDTVWANAFHIRIRQNGTTVFQSVLGSRTSDEGGRKEGKHWDYAIPDEHIHYHALYPQSWTTFELPQFQLKVIGRQISPFIPHDYRDSCLPVTYFEWTVENLGDNEYEVSVAMTWKNGWGTKEDAQMDATVKTISAQSDFLGLEMQQTFRDLRLTYGIAVKKAEHVKVQAMNSFDPIRDDKSFWQELQGEPLSSHSKTLPSPDNLCMALKGSMDCPPDSNRSMEFSLCWDVPEIQFGARARTWTRRYATMFSSTQDNSAASALLEHTFKKVSNWRQSIQQWQNEALKDPGLPDWFKSAIFNELYYIADGGTQWLDMSKSDLPNDDIRREYGRFGYLESHEYRLYNTYDVHFYASTALLSLFPGLQLSLQADYCDATQTEDPTLVWELYGGNWVPLNKAFSVPHDLGDPEDDPWIKVNAYRIHDVSEWRDLNLKFVISLWRDIYWATQVQKDEKIRKAAELLAEKAWPICQKVMEKSIKWDTDGDGLIENSGKPDQTYDTWVMSGPSAYCGGLWVTAVSAMIQFCQKFGHQHDSWSSILAKAQEAFNQKIWYSGPNDPLFKFDANSGSNLVMSDQLCGYWYAMFMGPNVQGSSLKDEQVRKALETIFKYNVEKFGDGQKGAVNGMLIKEGQRDRSTVQSEECWTGSTYALASVMLAKGNIEQGFTTAEGIYKTVYEAIGQGFETPEALYIEKHYRAIGYMRPLSIWAMFEAWKMRNNS